MGEYEEVHTINPRARNTRGREGEAPNHENFREKENQQHHETLYITLQHHITMLIPV